MKMEHRLVLLRHGESADKQPGQVDFDRVLTTRGASSIKLLADFFITKKIIPDIVLASPAVRTKQTAEILLKGLDLSLEPHFERDIYNGDDRVYLGHIEQRSTDAKCPLLVGHNPSISSLTSLLTRGPFIDLRPGQAVILEWESDVTRSVVVKTIGPF